MAHPFRPGMPQGGRARSGKRGKLIRQFVRKMRLKK